MQVIIVEDLSYEYPVEVLDASTPQAFADSALSLLRFFLASERIFMPEGEYETSEWDKPYIALKDQTDQLPESWQKEVQAVVREDQRARRIHRSRQATYATINHFLASNDLQGTYEQQGQMLPLAWGLLLAAKEDYGLKWSFRLVRPEVSYRNH